MHKPIDIPPVGPTNVIAPIKQRSSRQQRQDSNDGQQHKPAAKSPPTLDQHDSHISSSGNNNQGVDRYA